MVVPERVAVDVFDAVAVEDAERLLVDVFVIVAELEEVLDAVDVFDAIEESVEVFEPAADRVAVRVGQEVKEGRTDIVEVRVEVVERVGIAPIWARFRGIQLGSGIISKEATGSTSALRNAPCPAEAPPGSNERPTRSKQKDARRIL